MTEKEKDPRKEFELALARLDEKLENIKENIDILKDELADKTRGLEELIKKVDSFQRTILEPNQQTIYTEVQKRDRTTSKPEEFGDQRNI